MKTIELLAVLSQQETEEFSENLKKQKRTSLFDLYNCLQNNNQLPQKDQLYFSTFKEKYSPEKDYLLRNEFRLLNKEIEKFIILKEVCDVFSAEPNKLNEFLLNRYLRTSKFKLYEKTWNAALRHAIREFDFENLYKLNLLWVNYLRNHREISTGNLNELINSLNNCSAYLHAIRGMQLAQLSFHESYSLRISKVIGAGQLIERNESLPLTHQQYFDHYVHYYTSMSNAYSTKGVEKLEFLKNCIPSLDFLMDSSPGFRKEKIRVLGNIAVEYFIMQEFEKANQWYLQALQLMDKHHVMIDLVFNYAVNLIPLGRYQEMVDIYYKYKMKIKETPKVNYRFEYFTCLALALMNKPEEAYNILNHEIQQRPEKDYFYFRLIYAVLAFQQGEYADCLRELDNIKQSPRYKNHLDLDELRMMKWIRRLARVYDKPLSKDERKANLKVLANAYISEVSKIPIETTILEQWFFQKLKDGGVARLTSK